MPEQIRLALRLDDPSAHSNHLLESEIIRRLQKHRTPATFAVIPFSNQDGRAACLEAVEVPHLLEAQRTGILDIALHGHTHTAYRRLADNNQTEFCDRPADEQFDLLSQGKDCLEGIFGPVKGFVPPWNSFDGDTLEALQRLGFEYLSAGWDYTPAGLDRFPVLAHSCNLPEVELAIEEARELKHLSPAVLVIMHHYDFVESGSEEARIDLDRLDILLALIAAQDDVELVTLAQLAQSLGAECSAANVRYHHWRERRHWRLNRLLPQRVLLGTPPSRLRSGLALHAARHIRRALT